MRGTDQKENVNKTHDPINKEIKARSRVTKFNPSPIFSTDIILY